MWLCASGCAPSSLQIQLPDQPLEARIPAQRIPDGCDLQVAQPEITFCVSFFQQRQRWLLVAERNANKGQSYGRHVLPCRAILEEREQIHSLAPFSRACEDQRARGDLISRWFADLVELRQR